MLANFLFKTVFTMYIFILVIIVAVVMLYTLHTKNDKKESNKVSSYPKKRERLNKREDRRIRHKKVWLILRYMVTLQDLHDSSDFYEFRDNREKCLDIKRQMAEENPSNEHFDIAFRFCKIEHVNKRCKRNISIEDQKQIRNWRDYDVEISQIALGVISKYEQYWDNVIASYKRVDAKINRIKYIVEDLDKIRKDSLMQDAEIQKNLIALQPKYIKDKVMEATVSLNGILAFIQSLSLSANNQRWLGEKLIETAKTKAESTEKESYAAFINRMCGAWNDDERSTEEIINDIRQSRQFDNTRHIMSLSE